MPYPCIHSEGGLIPADILEEIAAGESPGQTAADFGLPRSARLTDEIAAAWADARVYWEAFQHGLRRLPDADPATTVTREQWALPLLRSLGYETITFMPRAALVGNSTYAISHRAGDDENAPPLHVAGCRADLDRRPPAGRPRLSPHALVQEYLNRTEHLWGIVANGYQLRLLRNSALMTRPSYVEFDLQQMLAGEHFADFTVFYRLVHRSRLPVAVEDAADCWLEGYFQQALEQGGRVRDRLRDGVEEALQLFGSGFLRHPASGPLRHKVHTGNLSATAYYRQLLRLVYRLLFLMVSEERHLVGPDDPAQAGIYCRYYSLSRLRDLAEEYLVSDERHGDLWQGLCQTFRLYEDEDIARRLGMHALDADLFGPHAIPDLESAQLYNVDLLRALRHLSLYRERHVIRRVNYAALDVEELGSVYESLLEYHPVVEERDGRPIFAFVLGSERKTTGSYYTRPELVQELIKSALEPVIEERLKTVQLEEGKTKTPGGKANDHVSRFTDYESALLSIKVCDPAAGSGHFLLAAARRLGRELARVRSGEEHPTPGAFRQAVRDVIQHCIYGVDKNPLAVDLCKVALWLEGHNQGMPLTFLDHRIKCGDSLVGVLDLDVLTEGIPDDAFKPVSGDDKKLASDLRKRNKQEREGQLELFAPPARPDTASLADLWRRLGETPDDAVEAVRRKQQTYEGVRAQGTNWWTLWTACNLWTAAFFVPVEKGAGDRVPTSAAVRRYLSNPGAGYGPMVGAANALAVEHPFFHWPLEFPDVFAEGGFGVVLSNPPWEQIELQEQEFFAAYDREIANAPNKAARERLIEQLPQTNSALWSRYQAAKYEAEALSKFLRGGERYPLTARGRINTYQVFAELMAWLVNPSGRVGMILPTGIVTDYHTQDFFAELVNTQRLQKLVGFENEAFIFPAVHHAFKFCALTVGAVEMTCEEPDYVFFCRYFSEVEEPLRHFTLTRDDIARINPNTRTCPVFRTRPDAELTRKIYARVPVLDNEAAGENPWGVSFRQGLFNMSGDSGLFQARDQLGARGGVLQGNHFLVGNEAWLPLYEAKMIWHFDHRFGSYARRTDRGFTNLDPIAPEQHSDSQFVPLPFYWVHTENIDKRLTDWGRAWLLGFRDVTNATNERTVIFSLLPIAGVGHTAPLVFCQAEVSRLTGFIGNANSLVFDYVARQKIGGMHLTFSLLRQLPTLLPNSYDTASLNFIIPRVLELVYTAWDVKPFVDDVWREADQSLRTVLKAQWDANVAATGGHVGAEPPEWMVSAPDGFPYPPFKWDEDRRAILRAELDAHYARLYGLTEEELRYILDPADVYGEDFPGETFRVLKEKEIKQYGEYRTQRLVLEAWKRLKS
jgi:hypothetical protein